MDTYEEDDVENMSEEDLKDKFCDPDNPIVVQFQEVSAAAYKIKGGIERTPCNVSSVMKYYNRCM